MLNPFVRRLMSGANLSPSDQSALADAVAKRQEFKANQVLIHDGDPPFAVNVVLEGFACRFKHLANGRRQIMGFLIPGDMCDLHASILGGMDHSIGAMTDCKIAKIAPDTIEALMLGSRSIARAFWWATLVDVSTCREWMTSMGQRPAEKQLAHLLCELLVRLQAVGLATDNAYDLAITQEIFGDTLGMSAVHINRSLQSLREAGLVVFKKRRMEIIDVPKLQEFSGFEPDYLHLKHPNPLVNCNLCNTTNDVAPSRGAR